MRPGYTEQTAVRSARRFTRKHGARDSEHDLAQLIEAAGDAIVSGRPDGTIDTWNHGAQRLFGYSAKEIVGRSFARLMPPEDLPRAKQVHATAAAGRPFPEIETKAICKDGSAVDVSLSVSPILDQSGELARVVAICRDITERKALDAQRREAEQRWAGAFNNAPIGMALVSTAGTFLNVNPSCCEFLGRSDEELRRLTFQEISHPEDLESDMESLRRLLAGEIARYEIEKRYLRPGGSVVWGQLCVSLVRDEVGEPHHFVSQIKDITELKRQDTELHRLATHLRDLSQRDPLTGLANPRAFEQRVDAALEQAGADPSPLTLVLVDLDDLKAHNAVHGRLAGDRVLIAAAGILDAEAADGADAFRIGGDEFAILLEGDDVDAGARCVERVRRAIDDGPLGVSAALAVVASPADGVTRQELLERADLSLQAAREGGGRLPLPAGTPAIAPPGQSELILDSLCARLDLTAACLSGGERDLVGAAGGKAAELGVRPGHPISEAEAPPLSSISLEDPDATQMTAVHCFAEAGREPLDARQRELVRFAGALVGQTLTQEAADALQRTADMELSGVAALVAALEARDHYTAEHSRRVVDLAGAVAQRLALDVATVATVERVAVLHDVGKVAVPDSILQKPGPLSASEWELMRQHPAVGERIVASTRTLAHLAAPIRAEHERYDGRGYPDGLAGDEIPIASRITLACDAYHAMTSARPYRDAMDVCEARAELLSNAGSQFDPDVVAALIEELDSALAA